MVYANVFGGQFPVCNEQQKAQIEEAYAKLIEQDKTSPIRQTHECMCDLIIRLLNGGADHSTQISAAMFIAKIIYTEKTLIRELYEQMEKMMMMPQGNKETVH